MIIQVLTVSALCPAASSAFAELPASEAICSLLRPPGAEFVQVVFRLTPVLILWAWSSLRTIFISR